MMLADREGQSVHDAVFRTLIRQQFFSDLGDTHPKITPVVIPHISELIGLNKGTGRCEFTVFLYEKRRRSVDVC